MPFIEMYQIKNEWQNSLNEIDIEKTSKIKGCLTFTKLVRLLHFIFTSNAHRKEPRNIFDEKVD